MRRGALALAVLATAAASLVPVAGAAQPRTSLPDVEDEVMCTICGTALNLSQAPQADRERAFIRREIARGRTKEEIKQALVRQYGPNVLATPGDSGFDLAAWIVPGVGIAIVAVALVVGVRRWRRRGAEAGEEPEPEPLDQDDEQRLRSDLARYDL